MEPFQAPTCCALALPHSAPPCSLGAPSKAALLPFPNQNGNPRSSVRGVYNVYIYTRKPFKKTRKQENKKKRKKSPSNLAIHLYSSPLQLALQAACLVLGAGGKEDEEKLRVEDGEKGCAKTETILVISPSFCMGEIRSVLFS